jgi:hypothetical protein
VRDDAVHFIVGIEHEPRKRWPVEFYPLGPCRSCAVQA